MSRYVNYSTKKIKISIKQAVTGILKYLLIFNDVPYPGDKIAILFKFISSTNNWTVRSAIILADGDKKYKLLDSSANPINSDFGIKIGIRETNPDAISIWLSSNGPRIALIYFLDETFLKILKDFISSLSVL